MPCKNYNTRLKGKNSNIKRDSKPGPPDWSFINSTVLMNGIKFKSGNCTRIATRYRPVCVEFEAYSIGIWYYLFIIFEFNVGQKGSQPWDRHFRSIINYASNYVDRWQFRSLLALIILGSWLTVDEIYQKKKTLDFCRLRIKKIMNKIY